MAGDWIKVEKSTPAKPEVLQISELLGIHPMHAFGLCVRFWMWCDDQLHDGNARGVTNVTLDFVIGHAGMTNALVKVGWLRDRSGSLEVPNFDRHLSEGAKNRALTKERVSKKRNANVTLQPLPEKRREDISTHTQGADAPPASSSSKLETILEQLPNSVQRASTLLEGEIPTLDQAISSVGNAGIPPDFAKFCYETWAAQGGTNANGRPVPWVRYAAKRWGQEGEQWKAGTHWSQRSAAGGGGSANGNGKRRSRAADEPAASYKAPTYKPPENWRQILIDRSEGEWDIPEKWEDVPDSLQFHAIWLVEQAEKEAAKQ